MSFQNDDLFLVNRGGDSFKTEYVQLKQSINEDSGVHVDDNPPADPNDGDLWFNSDDGRLYVWYVTETTGIVTDVNVRNGGSGYNSAGTDVSTNGGSGTGLTINYQAGVGGTLVNPTVNSGGHSYNVGDVVFVTGSGHANGSLSVTAVNSEPVGQWVDASPDSPSANLWEKNGTTLSPVNDGDSVDIGSGNIELNADGTIKAGGDLGGGFGYGIELNSSPTGTSWVGYGSGNALAVAADGGKTKATVNYVGTPSADPNDWSFRVAQFDGSYNLIGAKFLIGSDGSTYVGGTLPTSPNITLNADGSGTFAGNLKALNFESFKSGIGTYFKTPYLFQVTDNNDANVLVLNTASGNGMELNSATAAKLTAGQWDSFASERRIKQDIQPINPAKAWEVTKAVPYRTYELKANPELGKVYGCIVDEIEPVAPELIYEGSTSDEEGVIRTYNSTGLQAMQAIALQTALTRIETLEATNASLEARLTALEGGN